MRAHGGGARGRLAAAALALLTCAGCGANAAGSTPTWVPQPDFQAGAAPQPQLPGQGVPLPQPSSPSSSSGASPGAPGSSPPSSPAADPSVVATGLNQPTGLVVLPDGTALVGERTTGRIYRVQPTAGHKPELVQTLTVDGSGDGGLLDLAISPTYSQDGLVYAYLTTASDNRVVHFAIGGAASVVIAGIPKGATDNAGRIAFDATGALLTGTGDAGQPALAASPASLAGKILRTNDIGQPSPDNPTPGSPVYARGLRTVDGLCVDARTGARVAISAGAANKADEVDVIEAGADYGWPSVTASSKAAAATLPAKTPGGQGCALASGVLAVATSTGKSVLVATISDGKVGAFTSSLDGKYGRLRTVVAGGDGALWITTDNRGPQGNPIPADDRVVRITSVESGGSSIV